MKKTKSHLGVAIVRLGNKSVRARVFLLCLGFFYVFGFADNSYALTCAESGSCVRTVLVYYKLSSKNFYSQGSYPPSAFDHTCTVMYCHAFLWMSTAPVTLYRYKAFKYYWNGTEWKYHSSVTQVQHTCVGSSFYPALASADYIKELLRADYNDQESLLQLALIHSDPASLLPPSGCSDDTSQEPDQTPNPAPGKPDCPQVPLN